VYGQDWARGVKRRAHLLDAVPDGLELIGKVLAASIGGVEVALCTDKRETRM